jgi:putative component of membrane protein insertase Oxa1/YidC/SpoIIIJ protein YidD
MKICITILLAAISFQFSLSQTAEELTLLRSDRCCAGHETNYKKEAKGGIVNMLFVFYKVCISSQDFNSCVFTPSCSEYAVQSINKQGFVRGIFDSVDRLTRCHGFRSSDYTIDPEINRLIDPVKNIRYENP